MVERHGVTILGVSPTLIRALIKHGVEPVRSHDLSRLRILASTGEPWDPESWRWLFENVGGGRLPIINITGGTEVGACLLSAFPITPLKPCSLVGPSLGMAVDVYDPDGRPLRQGVGELVCTKPWPAMTRGIWGDPERYLATYWSRWPDVWVHGDWASIDEDGDWFLHGRSDDTIKVAGKRLGPAEVESILAGHDAVAESAAVGVPAQHQGRSHPLLRRHPARPLPSDSLRAELCDRVAEALGKSFAPEGVRFVAELPKTRSGKILRRVIQRVATGQDPGDLFDHREPRGHRGHPGGGVSGIGGGIMTRLDQGNHVLNSSRDALSPRNTPKAAARSRRTRAMAKAARMTSTRSRRAPTPIVILRASRWSTRANPRRRCRQAARRPGRGQRPQRDRLEQAPTFGRGNHGRVALPRPRTRSIRRPSKRVTGLRHCMPTIFCGAGGLRNSTT